MYVHNHGLSCGFRQVFYHSLIACNDILDIDVINIHAYKTFIFLQTLHVNPPPPPLISKNLLSVLSYKLIQAVHVVITCYISLTNDEYP